MELVNINPGKEPGYEMRESLRTFRTNISFCGVDVRVIMFTSSVPDEGKTTVVFNLARALRDSGKKVLIVDSDMRKSVMIQRYHATRPNNQEISGLSHYLSGQKAAADVLYQTNETGIFMTFAGPSVSNPTEMLERKEFEKFIDIGKKYFDYILIDCAPLGAAIDAAVVARVCDGAIMVVEQGGVGARMILENKKQLEASGVRILGAVLNKVRTEGSGYYGHYYKRYYGKYYGKYYTNEKKDKKKSKKKSK
ncbi:MAG: CpsD/CapB family tyrosine-protein kinase [Lachnospiraceae bacterium]|nr:CpsD/CapB family tyrosine-protein kinase [Lachnospiraceae bacterium]